MGTIHPTTCREKARLLHINNEGRHRKEKSASNSVRLTLCIHTRTLISASLSLVLVARLSSQTTPPRCCYSSCSTVRNSVLSSLPKTVLRSKERRWTHAEIIRAHFWGENTVMIPQWFARTRNLRLFRPASPSLSIHTGIMYQMDVCV